MIRKDGHEGCDHADEDGSRDCYQPAEVKCVHGSFCSYHSPYHYGYRGRGRFAQPCPSLVKLEVRIEFRGPLQG